VILSTKPAERRASYSSPAIVARRKRILDLTRALIAERGYVQFSVGELGLRAGVAKQTIYNIFGSKERMIATAINEYFKEREESIPYTSRPATMERMIERVVIAGRRSQLMPNYLAALMAIYHSVDTDPDIWNAIHSVSTYPQAAWIESLAERGQLQPWIDPVVLIDEVAAQRNLILLEWCRGKLGDEESIHRKLVGALTLMAGATRGAARGKVEARLRQIIAEGLPAYELPPPDSDSNPPAAANG
jgi:AcrR family transcriptional regulator